MSNADTEDDVIDEPDADVSADVAVEVESDAIDDSDSASISTEVEDAALEELTGPVASEEPTPPVAGGLGLAPVLEVPVSLVVELGRTSMTIGETLRIGRGSIVTLDKEAGEPAELLVNGQLIARGEVVAIDEEFGLRITEVVSPERRLEAGRS